MMPIVAHTPTASGKTMFWLAQLRECWRTSIGRLASNAARRAPAIDHAGWTSTLPSDSSAAAPVASSSKEQWAIASIASARSSLATYSWRALTGSVSIRRQPCWRCSAPLTRAVHSAR